MDKKVLVDQAFDFELEPFVNKGKFNMSIDYSSYNLVWPDGKRRVVVNRSWNDSSKVSQKFKGKRVYGRADQGVFVPDDLVGFVKMIAA